MFHWWPNQSVQILLKKTHPCNRYFPFIHCIVQHFQKLAKWTLEKWYRCKMIQLLRMRRNRLIPVLKHHDSKLLKHDSQILKHIMIVSFWNIMIVTFWNIMIASLSHIVSVSDCCYIDHQFFFFKRFWYSAKGIWSFWYNKIDNQFWPFWYT